MLELAQNVICSLYDYLFPTPGQSTNPGINFVSSNVICSLYDYLFPTPGQLRR